MSAVVEGYEGGGVHREFQELVPGTWEDGATGDSRLDPSLALDSIDIPETFVRSDNGSPDPIEKNTGDETIDDTPEDAPDEVLPLDDVDSTTSPECVQASSVACADVTKTSPAAKNSTIRNQGDAFAACSKPELQSLPIDSLHYVASFLTPSEWCNGFGLINQATRSHCREIVRRVRVHGFKCATEVVSAWKLGQWEDARELSALYVAAGVPIYSRCLGHSFHTLNWRMKVEAAEIRAKHSSNEESEGMNGSDKTKGDSFFGSARTEFRLNEGHGRDISYLEEKCLFHVSQRSLVNPANLRRRTNARHQEGTAPRSNSPLQARAGLSPEINTQKIPLLIHQHLLDRHNLNENMINDLDGRMGTPMIVMAADFFHPSACRLTKSKSDMSTPGELDINRASLQRSNTVMSTVADEDTTVWDPVRGDEIPPPNVVPTLVDSGDLAVVEQQSPKSAISSVLLDVYSSTVSSSSEGLDDIQEVRRQLRTRFSSYHRRLETFLAKGDSLGFEECMLDFWDEFFPHTAGIHYHDLQTAVPRMSCMNKFLTKPCPKAIGVVQCEIERIKISTRGKGVNVTGRLFPTYEYRLFIRNRPQTATGEVLEGPANAVPCDFVRRDTVLMVAKNRGRKHSEPGGVIPMSVASKKGSNNYYLYVPQQADVDDHFTKSNEHLSKPIKVDSPGPSRDPVLASDDTGSGVLGRLQSNFIGTEFQIFTPRLRKQPRHKPDLTATSQAFCSDDEHDDDSGVSSDNARRSRFIRFRRTAASNPSNLDGTVGHLFVPDRPKVKRPTSSPDLSDRPHGRQPRTNRRAIANDAMPSPHSALCEEEGGAITYTANLLGSRPRIMDVCIPKVTPDGVSGIEWKRYLDSCDDTDDCRMLSCFRLLQQRRENQEQNQPVPDAAHDGESDNGEEADFGLMALQNRPPWWNVELGSFVLNFGGRVSVASVKNFQLCERTNQDYIMLQFGRIDGRHSFTMDFQHPLTAVQAFSIAISSLQSKISFG